MSQRLVLEVCDDLLDDGVIAVLSLDERDVLVTVCEETEVPPGTVLVRDAVAADGQASSMIESGLQWMGWASRTQRARPNPQAAPSVQVNHATVHHAGYVWTRAER